MRSRDIWISLQNGEMVNIDTGMPPKDFYSVAWGDEPLTTKALIGTDIPYSLPLGQPDCSYLAKNNHGDVIGQCSTNDVVAYWDHINACNITGTNEATKCFIEIHQLAVKVQSDYAFINRFDSAVCAHIAGIAVLPNHRRQKVATLLTEHQIQELKQAGKKALFAETTNHKSAGIMRKLNFFKVASYPYNELAKTIGNSSLTTLEDDSFTVWCKTL